MDTASYKLTGNALIPAVIRIGERETPVWLQQRWEAGEYARYIRANGCGHCCTAMAARLHGVDLDPYHEYLLCRSLWGPPKELPNDQGQDHFLSLAGIVRILHNVGIPAQPFGVRDIGPERAAAHIAELLAQNKQVIFTSDPDYYPDNPFSSGYHWVMAVGFSGDGTILIANSSEKAAPNGVQFVTQDIIAKALFKESTADPNMTWGELVRLYDGCGYIAVG